MHVYFERQDELKVSLDKIFKLFICHQKKFLSWIEETGFQKVTFNKLSFGIVSIYFGYKALK